MKTNVKVDIDKRYFVSEFKFRIRNIYRIFYSKREYFPNLYVYHVDQTRKGWHVFINYEDREDSNKDLAEHDLRSYFGDDRNRLIYDYLRVAKKDKDRSLMFSWKKGKKVISRRDVKINLNKYIKKMETKWNNKNNKTLKNIFKGIK